MHEFSYEEWLGSQVDSLTRTAIEDAPYDAVFYIAAYNYADVGLKKDATLAWKDIKGLFPTGTRMDDVGWRAAYNVKIERILHENDRTTYVDSAGSFCWKDEDETHCGDLPHLYPFYDEALLQEALS